MACWNSVIPTCAPSFLRRSGRRSSTASRAHCLCTNVFIRTGHRSRSSAWPTSRAPSGYHPSVQLPEPVSIGKHQCSRTPDEPTVLHLVRTPCAPGKPRKEQHRLGRAELLSTSFETFEREIRDQLARTLADGGSDPARDIAGITVNRWPHGYTYNYNTLEDPVAWALVARRPGVRRRPAAVRPHLDRQRGCGGQLAHRRRDRHGPRAVREVVESRTAEAIAALTPSRS